MPVESPATNSRQKGRQGDVTMDAFYWILAAPGIAAIGFGLCHLLWMAIGIRLPKRRPSLAAASESAGRTNVPVRKRPARLHNARNRMGIAAAVPQGAQHGSGSHLDN